MSATRKVIVVFVLALMVAFAAVAGFTGDAVAEGDKVVAFVAFSDREEEWLNTKKAISQFIPDFKPHEILEKDPDLDKLQAALDQAEIFIIPEQEEASRSTLESLGRKWRALLEKFLQRGGRVIGLDYAEGGSDILRGAGLISAKSSLDIITGETLEVVAATHLIVEGVSLTFIGEEGTTSGCR